MILFLFLFKVDIPDGVTSRPADLCHYYFSFDLFPETTYFMMKQDLILCIFPIEIHPYSENYSDWKEINTVNWMTSNPSFSENKVMKILVSNIIV